MKLPEKQTKQTLNYQQIYQAKRDNALTSKNRTDPRLIGFAVVVVGSLLFVTAIYFGIINT
jgi:hypothetical protein